MAWKYYLRPERCRACRACVNVCPSDAIVEIKREIPDIELHPSFTRTFIIDQTRCTRCGACMAACKLRVIQKKFCLR